ncbi:beta strand repeat-containing protein [Wenzhouxiangella sp. EGI_FJ10305]|uniref:beta strand repeat-containing protein n=1 Tax=Wenzhouxiangella sp. EGI_FJ10305 TaxID=3243768 RepID=UPI0035DF74BC
MRNDRLPVFPEILIALILLMPVASMATSNEAPFAKQSPNAAQDFDASLGELVDENGHVVLPDDFSGSIDPTGFQMVSQEGQAPRFVRSGSTNDQWSEGEFGVPGCSGSVVAATVINGELFLGGNIFRACGFAATSSVARFNPTTGEFAALGDGVNGAVNTLAAIGEALYVGGTFDQAGGASANHIAVYDTTQSGNAGWSTLGDGVNNWVHAMAAIGDDLYVGGSFNQAGGTSTSRLAVYDTTQTGNAGWSALGDGVNGGVLALAAIGDDLYVGGAFSEAGGTSISRLAAYDTTQTGNAGWSALGDGVNNGQVNALVAIGDDLYIGGEFNQAGSAPANSIAVYDTAQASNAGWSTLGDGVNGSVRNVLALTAIGDDLYVGGSFTQAGGSSTKHLAVYDTAQTGNAGWSTLGQGVNNNVSTFANVSTLATIGDDLYVGGGFVTAGGIGLSHVAVYDTTLTGNAGWSAIEDGVSAPMRALVAIGDDLYAGGDFTRTGAVPADYIAVYDTSQPGSGGWSALGTGLDDTVWALAAIGDDLYVGGDFTQAGGAPADNIAVYDTTQTGNAGWSTLGDGTNSSVYALAAISDDLYVGGLFTQAGNAPASLIAVYDTAQTGNAGWSVLGDGVDNTVFALAAMEDNLYVGGAFTQAGGTPTNRIGIYDTTQTGNAGWSALGDGVDSTVRALAAIDNNLYVGGFFEHAGGAPADHIAAFDTSQTGNAGWSGLGDGMDSSVYALAPSGDNLYVGGRFGQAGSMAANNIAVYDTSQTSNAGWSALGNGAGLFVYALNFIGGELYVGGIFTQAGGNVNAYLAHYNTNPNHLPVAQSDSVATDEDATFDGNTLSDNGNGIDEDPDGDPLSVTEVNGVPGNVGAQITLASGALLTVDTSGAFIYDPNGQFESLAVGDTATDTFDYTISDGIASDSATVTITINGANDAPVANVDARTTGEASVLVASDADGTGTDGDSSDDGVLVNDTDIDGDVLTVDQVEGSAGNLGTAVSLPSGATVTAAADGTFVYDPNGQFVGLDVGEQGSDAFSYRATDGNATATAEVDITIDGVNDPPAAAADAFTSDEDVQLAGNVFADNGSGPDSDPDDPLSVMNPGTLTATGLGGSVDLQANGDFIYTPPADASGSDTFDYTLEDDNGATSSATVTITVEPVDDPPVAVDDAASLDEDAAPTAIDVLANDTDVDGGPIAIDAVTQPAAGTVVVTGGGLTYEPTADACNDGAPPNDFSYTLAPGGSSATVAVSVACINDAPTFVAGSDVETLEDTAFSQTWATDVSAGPEESSQTLAFEVTTDNASLFDQQPAIDANGLLTFTPAPDVTGTATATVVLSDDGGTANGGSDESAPATFDIAVNAGADIQVDKTVEVSTLQTGALLTYTVIVSNSGPSDVSGIAVEDNPPAVLNGVSWSCMAAGSASCSETSGSGAVSLTADIPEGDSVTVELTGTIPEITSDEISNTATATIPSGVVDIDETSNTNTATIAIGIFSDRFEQ